ncbi:StAR-related lipid transfer protein [Elysia marginata]|uniref:StAR-related lipid transfer protein n=1 Tax=Elysia marginata TaxID=1093978 RepID=A0AAV4H0L3_9GAST|nr:StAR-related lipid transfer protein [Elysia marginata]
MLYLRLYSWCESTRLRITLTVDAPLELCKSTITLMPGSRRPEWDQDVREIKLIKDIDDKTVLFYVHTNPVGKGVISAREFVDVGRTEVTENQVSVFGCSVDHPPLQTENKYVRGNNAFWMHRFTKDPTKEGRTKIESVLDSDMKGWIPSSIMNTTLPVVFSQALITWLGFINKEKNS